MKSTVQKSGGSNNENQDIQGSGRKGQDARNPQSKSEDTRVSKSENRDNAHSKNQNHLSGTAASKGRGTLNLNDSKQNPIRFTCKSQEIPAVSKTARDKTILSSSIATDNNASSEPKDDNG